MEVFFFGLHTKLKYHSHVALHCVVVEGALGSQHSRHASQSTRRRIVHNRQSWSSLIQINGSNRNGWSVIQTRLSTARECSFFHNIFFLLLFFLFFIGHRNGFDHIFFFFLISSGYHRHHRRGSKTSLHYINRHKYAWYTPHRTQRELISYY